MIDENYHLPITDYQLVFMLTKTLFERENVCKLEMADAIENCVGVLLIYALKRFFFSTWDFNQIQMQKIKSSCFKTE